jgi:DNA-binding XRE family transcriptional regulator
MTHTLREAREKRGWSLQDLAGASGVDRTTIHKIEKGHEPGVKKAISLAKAVEMAVEDLWGSSTAAGSRATNSRPTTPTGKEGPR